MIHPRPAMIGLAAAILVGCTPSAATGPAGATPVRTADRPSPSGTSESPTATAPTTTGRVEAVIQAEDGLEIRGTYLAGRNPDGSAALLLPMYGADRATWAAFAEALADSGLASLAIDLRGQGATGGAEDWGLARSDVSRAFDWLAGQPGIDPDRIAVIGASIGANLALVQAASSPGAVAAVGLLSPGFDYFRVRIDGLTPQLGDTPLFLAASEGDGYSASTVRQIAGEAGGRPTLVVLDGSAHGTALFAAHPELERMLIQFVKESLGD
jgi:acetyl esterase/lipase